MATLKLTAPLVCRRFTNGLLSATRQVTLEPGTELQDMGRTRNGGVYLFAPATGRKHDRSYFANAESLDRVAVPYAQTRETVRQMMDDFDRAQAGA